MLIDKNRLRVCFVVNYLWGGMYTDGRTDVYRGPGKTADFEYVFRVQKRTLRNAPFGPREIYANGKNTGFPEKTIAREQVNSCSTRLMKR